MTERHRSPFRAEGVDDVQLTDAPLVSVVAQLRFPLIAAFNEMAGITVVQTALQDSYPVMRQEMQAMATLSPDGNIVQSNGTTVWRFTGGDDGWTATLTPTWIAVETTNYTNRADFLSHWKTVLDALAAHPNAPRVFDRLGVRYVDQLRGAEATTEALRRFVKPAVLGAIEVETALADGAQLVGTITQAHFDFAGPVMLARWGRIPADAVVIPGIPPVNEVSWFLDVDVFEEAAPKPFSVESVDSLSAQFAAHAYDFFRLAVTDELLRSRGGAV